MKVYLDNCIIVDIEKGKYSLSDFKKEGCEYFYSCTHFDELRRGLPNNPNLKGIRLKTISQLCGTNYIVPDVLGLFVGIEQKEPIEVFKQLEILEFLIKECERSANLFHPDRDGVLQELSMNKIEVGNVNEERIFEVIDERMRNSVNRFGIQEYLKRSEAYTGRTTFITLFNLLDAACYWKDDKSLNRIYDASHAYFAQYCDVLVTNDKRLSIKAKAVYHYLNIKTKVFSGETFLKNSER